MVVIESNLLPPDPAVVVIPLLSDYPAVKHLNPEITLDDKRLVLATHRKRGRSRRLHHQSRGCFDGRGVGAGAVTGCPFRAGLWGAGAIHL
jgi:toxin CcdB